mmetsp:Transcript_20308/g.36899  ORF Transcript_20308/g.36899 Transcript_20308/m.36899 type:complete len:1177 (+) Transcript_20308:84-3614(+)
MDSEAEEEPAATQDLCIVEAAHALASLEDGGGAPNSLVVSEQVSESGTFSSPGACASVVATALAQLKSLSSRASGHNYATALLHCFHSTAAALEGVRSGKFGFDGRLAEVLTRAAREAKAFNVAECPDGHRLCKLSVEGKRDRTCGVCDRELAMGKERWTGCHACRFALCPCCSSSGGSISLLLFKHVGHMLGGENGSRAPRDRTIRAFAARVFARLLPAVIASGDAGAQDEAAAVLHRLCRDRAVGVRLAAVSGLACTGDRCATELSRLAYSDCRAAVRTAALTQLLHAGDFSIENLVGRALDVSPVVRRRFFTLVAGSLTTTSKQQLTLMSKGMLDSNLAVRSKCKASILSTRKLAGGTLIEEVREALQHCPVDQSVSAMDFGERLIRSIWEEIGGEFPLPASDDAGRELDAVGFLTWRVVCTAYPGNAAATVAKDSLAQVLQHADRAFRAGHAFALQQVLLVLLAACEDGFRIQADDLPLAYDLATRILQCRDLQDVPSQDGQLMASTADRTCRALAAALLNVTCEAGCGTSEEIPPFTSAIADVLKVLRVSIPASETSEPALAEDHASSILHVLRVLEAALPLSCDLAETDPMHDVCATLLQPACAMADRMEQQHGLSLQRAWVEVRVVAVRCVALYASIAGAARGEAHWTFFLSVLQLPPPGDAQGELCVGAADAMVLTCVQFLTDTLLQGLLNHRLAEAARELFQALACVLQRMGGAAAMPFVPGQSAKASTPSLALRQQVASSLCTLFLYAGGGLQQPPELLSLVHQVEPGACWALTWLLIECFKVPLGSTASRSDGAAQADCFEHSMQAAAHRGRLLRFLSCLGRASTAHRRLLAAAIHTFLSTDLWELGLPTRLAHGFNWSPISLPRLLRLLSCELSQIHPRRHAAKSQGCDRAASSQPSPARLWCECLWQPLVLRCLDVVHPQRQRRRATQASAAAAAPSRAAEKLQAMRVGALASALHAAVSVLDPLLLPQPGLAEDHVDCALEADTWEGVVVQVRSMLQDIFRRWQPLAKDLDGIGGQTALTVVEGLCHRYGSSTCTNLEETYTASRTRRHNTASDLASLGVNCSQIVDEALAEARASCAQQLELLAHGQQACGGQGSFATVSAASQSAGAPRRVLQKRNTVSDDDSGQDAQPSQPSQPSEERKGRPPRKVARRKDTRPGNGGA